MTFLNPKKRDDVSARVIAGETVVLDRDGGRVHQLNATASYVWERCDGSASPTEIARDLSEQYDVEPDQAASDVTSLVGQFRELGLLESAVQ
ncbi:MAG: HPr-rel-A system PqqD family peptide chaperone [Vicinamibacteria bacterium]